MGHRRPGDMHAYSGKEGMNKSQIGDRLAAPMGLSRLAAGGAVVDGHPSGRAL